MKIGILSDLHLEFMGDRWRRFVRELPNESDVLVVAGDVTSGYPGAPTLAEVYAELCNRWAHVVAVLGNHEHYGREPSETFDAVAEALDRCAGRLHWLDRHRITIATIGGHRFLGATLWFRADPNAPRWMLNDFDAIGNFDPWVYEDNGMTRLFLRDHVRLGDIVVTHHLPSRICVHPKYHGSALNAFFVCDQEDLIRERQPALWIHGHTHESVDARIGDTRIVCNPYGYDGHEVNAAFEPGKVIEVTA